LQPMGVDCSLASTTMITVVPRDQAEQADNAVSVDAFKGLHNRMRERLQPRPLAGGRFASRGGPYQC
jgi:hypothetical protein